MQFNTPQTPDLFTRYMVDGFNENDIISVGTPWLPFFGDPNAEGSQTLFSPNRNALDIDIMKGNEKYAKMRLRGSGTQNIGEIIKGLRSEQFTTVSRTYPLMEDYGSISAAQLDERLFNENPYMDKTKQASFRTLARRQYNEIIRRFVRSFNLLAKQSILEGVQDAIFGTTNSDLQYDFYRDSDLFYTAPIAWDQTNAVIMANLDTICERVHQKGKKKPDAYFGAGDTIDAMINGTTFASQASNRRFNLTGIGSSDKVGANPVSTMPAKYQKFVDNGWMYRGWIQTPKGYELHLFTTTDYVEEDNGDITPMIPDGTGLVCYSQARCDRYFGPDERLPITPQRQRMYEEFMGIGIGASLPANIDNPGALVRPDMFYFDGWPNELWTNFQLRCQSAPIYATTHTDAFGVISGLTTP